MQPLFLSYFIDSDTPLYGGEKDCIKISSIRSISKGDTSNNLQFQFPAHIGTHIDFPYHFADNGKKSNDYPASFWIFNEIGFLNCKIENVENNLDELSSNIEILILKTGFGFNRNKDIYWSNQPVIPSSLAKLLRNKFPNLRVFGFDMISLTSKLNRSEGRLAHLSFLIENDILVLEDMNLLNLEYAPTKIIIGPLPINNADGVPCNVIAF
jgi:kynurenine formamidase